MQRRVRATSSFSSLQRPQVPLTPGGLGSRPAPTADSLEASGRHTAFIGLLRLPRQRCPRTVLARHTEPRAGRAPHQGTLQSQGTPPPGARDERHHGDAWGARWPLRPEERQGPGAGGRQRPGQWAR